MFHNKNKKSILFRNIIFLFCFVLFSSWQLALAGSVDYQRCEPNSSCLLGEYVFDNDGSPVGEQACLMYIKNPSGDTVADGATMNFESDGWHSYIATISSPEGLYRSLMCCTVGSDSACIDKSFILGTSFETLDDVESNTQLIRNATFDFSGLADAGSTDIALIDSELTGADDYWNDYDLEMITGSNAGEERSVTDFNSTSHTLSFSAFPYAISAGDKYVLRHESRLIFGIWNYTNRTLTSAVNIAGDIWNNSTRTLSSFGSLASDIWSDTFALTRTLTSKSLSGGESLSTESHSENLKDEIVNQVGITETNISVNSEALKDELMTEIGLVEVDIALTDTKVDTIITNTESLETKIDALNDIDSDISGIIAKWGDYSASDLSIKLDNIYKQVEEVSTADLDDGISDLEKKINENLDESKSLQNRAIEIRAMVDLNRALIENKPVVKTFYEWGSVVLKMVVANPSEIKQTINFRSALPKEIRPDDIINKSDDLKLEFDAENDRWFASSSVELTGKKSETKFVEVRDIWRISDDEIESLRRESEELSVPLKDTGFYAQSITIKNDISARLDKIKTVQNQESITPEEHILNYRENKIELETVNKNIESLKKLVSDTSDGNNFKGSLLGVLTVMTWSIILVVIVGVGILLIFLVIALRGRNANTYEKNEDIDFGKLQKNLVKKNTKLSKVEEKLEISSNKKIVFREIFRDIIIFVLCLAIIAGIFYVRKNREIFLKNEAEKTIISKEEEAKNENLENINNEIINEPMPEEKKIPVELSAEENVLEKEEVTSNVKKIKIKDTETGWLNLREEAGLEFSIIGKVFPENELEYIDKQEGWIKTKTTEGKEGWVSEQYVEILNND